MKVKSNMYLETTPVGSLMKKYSIPCIISLLVAALYNIVDQIFIANATYLGSYGNAANTVVFPLTVVALAIAVMIGDGCCAFVSISLGAGRKDDAHKSVGSAVLVCIIASVMLTIVYLTCMDGIIKAFGGSVNAETFACSKEYFFWISLGIPFYMFGQAMNPIIRSDGSPKFAMVTTVAGAVINIILDPIFIFPMHMGMKGAAIATVAGQIFTAVLSIWYLFHMKVVYLEKSSFRLHVRLMKKYIMLGITSFLSQISLVLAMAAINNMIRKYGALDEIFGQAEYAQIPMAVVGIVMKFFQIVISIAVGMAAGCIPIVGYNIGAGRKDRAKKLFTLLLSCEAIVGGIALVIVECFPMQLIGIFGASNESVYYTQFAVKSFRTYLCMMILATVNKGTFIYLQSLGKGVASMVISMVREIVFGVGFALILPIFFGLDGVLYSMPLSDILTFLIAAVIIRMTYQEKTLLCGSLRLLEEDGIDTSNLPKANVYTAYDGKVLGYVILSDRPREEAAKAIAQWKQSGIEKTVMLTGDSALSAQRVKEKCGVDEMRTDLLPQDKLTELQKLKAQGNKVIFVGDGINDAPVLAAADVGIAMGMGTDAAIEAADAVLMGEKLTSLTSAIKISRRALSVVHFNIWFILIIKLAVFALGIAGFANMWMAVFADVGVSIITVLDAVRILRFKD